VDCASQKATVAKSFRMGISKVKSPPSSSAIGGGVQGAIHDLGADSFTNSVQSLSLDFVLIYKGHSLSNFATLIQKAKRSSKNL
jgi:hypothetical protein